MYVCMYACMCIFFVHNHTIVTAISSPALAPVATADGPLDTEEAAVRFLMQVHTDTLLLDSHNTSFPH